jgi:hypothetical protein
MFSIQPRYRLQSPYQLGNACPLVHYPSRLTRPHGMTIHSPEVSLSIRSSWSWVDDTPHDPTLNAPAMDAFAPPRRRPPHLHGISPN